MRLHAGAALALLLAVSAAASTLPSADKFGHGAPTCVDTREDFNDPSVMLTVDEATAATPWVNEFAPYTAEIAGGSLVLRLTLVKNNTNKQGKNEGSQAAVSFNRWFDTGNVCFSLKSASGNGVVGAFIISSLVPEEPIDDNLLWEWVNNTQSNYYSFGKDAPVPNIYFIDSWSAYNTYCIQRCNNFVSWTLNGVEQRRLTLDSVANRTMFPYRPGKIIFNIWDGGNSGDNATAKWADGPTDWSDPVNPKYQLYVDWMQVTCGCPGETPLSATTASATGTATASSASATGTASSSASVYKPPSASTASTGATGTSSPGPAAATGTSAKSGAGQGASGPGAAAAALAALAGLAAAAL